MDLSHAERGTAARAAYQKDSVTTRDSALIANVLKAIPTPGTDQSLALGSVCPYWPSQGRERAAWVAEIRRQRGESEAE
jgi:hypothetical protein